MCLVPGHPDRSGQLRDQPVLRLAALAHRRRSGRRIRPGLRPQDGPQRVVKACRRHFASLISICLIQSAERLPVGVVFALMDGGAFSCCSFSLISVPSGLKRSILNTKRLISLRFHLEVLQSHFSGSTWSWVCINKYFIVLLQEKSDYLLLNSSGAFM